MRCLDPCNFNISIIVEVISGVTGFALLAASVRRNETICSYIVKR